MGVDVEDCMMRWRRWAAVLAVGLIGVLGAAEAGEAQENGIDGVWVLNQELSDDPSGRLDGGQQGGRGGFGPGGGFGGGRGGFGGGRGGFGGGRGGFGGGGGNRPDPQEMARLRESMQGAIRDLLGAPRRITIVSGDDEIGLTYNDGRVVRLIPDDREHAGLAGSSMQVQRKTRWDDERLVTEIELETRFPFRVEQTYEVRTDGGSGRQLIVTSRVERGRGSDGDREFRRVYDLQER